MRTLGKVGQFVVVHTLVNVAQTRDSSARTNGVVTLGVRLSIVGGGAAVSRFQRLVSHAPDLAGGVQRYGFHR